MHRIPAPDGDHEARLYFRPKGGWYLTLPDGEELTLVAVPGSIHNEQDAISVTLDILKDRGLWADGSSRDWRRWGEFARRERESPPPGLASPAAWREQHT